MKSIATIGLVVFAVLSIGFASQAMANGCNQFTVNVGLDSGGPGSMTILGVTCVHGKKLLVNKGGFIV